MGEVRGAPQGELAAVCTPLQIGEHQVRIRLDVPQNGFDVLPHADGVVARIDEQGGERDVPQAHLLHVKPGTAAIDARQFPALPERLHHPGRWAEHGSDQARPRLGFLDELSSVPECVEVLHAEVHKPTEGRLDPRDCTIRGHVVPWVVGHRAQQPWTRATSRPAASIGAILGCLLAPKARPSRPEAAGAGVAPREAGAAGEADDGNGPARLPLRH
mmetsp:Transcript_67058/g.218303  ORF Transcript_67058/g.218303 Transcript_67058/m.218303 type:complete len:216 (-) Transcript_67058:697-1344(-)